MTSSLWGNWQEKVPGSGSSGLDWGEKYKILVLGWLVSAQPGWQKDISMPLF